MVAVPSANKPGDGSRIIAGYALAELTPHGGELSSLAVLPAYRRIGVASILLAEILKKLRRAHATPVRLMVRRNNHAAIQLYQKFGFVRVATVANYYGGNSPGWRMRLDSVSNR